MVEQAGAVVFRDDGKVPRILLVRSRRRSRSWIFPKGTVERGEKAEDAALREAHEESGVVGDVVCELGKPVTRRSAKRVVRVRYFLVRRSDEMESPEGRKKRWLVPWRAFRLLARSDSRQLLLLALRELDALADGVDGRGKSRRRTGKTQIYGVGDMWRGLRHVLATLRSSLVGPRR
ncbi:MAG: NUDIX domain-containing protein [Gemmatimonadaceae bacterium]